MKNVPHIVYSNDLRKLRDFINVCKPKNDPITNAHFIDVNVNG